MFRHFEDTITHPVTLPILGILILMALVYLALSFTATDKTPADGRFAENKLLNALAWTGVVLALPGFLIFVAALWELGILAWNYPTPDTPASELRWHSSLMLAMLAAIGAVFTLAFAYIRVFTTERQTKAAEEQAAHNDRVLLNERFDAAASDLHSRRQFTQEIHSGAGTAFQDVWQDDVVKRNSAIDRLEELAEENLELLPRVKRMLSVYVRELSK